MQDKVSALFHIFTTGVEEDDQKSVPPKQVELAKHIVFQLLQADPEKFVLPTMSYVSESVLLEFRHLTVAVGEETTIVIPLLAIPIPLLAAEPCTDFRNIDLDVNTHDLIQLIQKFNH